VNGFKKSDSYKLPFALTTLNLSPPPINPVAKMEKIRTFIDSNVLFQTKSAITMSEKETFEFNAQRNTNFH
jgi:hypothetical protein